MKCKDCRHFWGIEEGDVFCSLLFVGSNADGAENWCPDFDSKHQNKRECKMYQIQIKKWDDEKAEWLPLYDGHETFSSVIDAIRRYFVIRWNHILHGIDMMWEMRIHII